MSQGYLADTVPAAQSNSGAVVAKKLRWLSRSEKGMGLRAIKAVLEEVAPPNNWRKLQALWQKLNRHVHPGVALVDRLLDPSALLVRDAFDKGWAMEAVKTATDVFDVVWLIVLQLFPHSIVKLAQEQHCIKYGLTGKMLKAV